MDFAIGSFTSYGFLKNQKKSNNDSRHIYKKTRHIYSHIYSDSGGGPHSDAQSACGAVS
jgi:hypothetical protein